MAVYRTRDGDMLDTICLAYYGQAGRYVEVVLSANPGLAAVGPVFPAGVLINLPDLPHLNQRQNTIRLWS